MVSRCVRACVRALRGCARQLEQQVYKGRGLSGEFGNFERGALIRKIRLKKKCTIQRVNCWALRMEKVGAPLGSWDGRVPNLNLGRLLDAREGIQLESSSNRVNIARNFGKASLQRRILSSQKSRGAGRRLLNA